MARSKAVEVDEKLDALVQEVGQKIAAMVKNETDFRTMCKRFMAMFAAQSRV